METFGFENHEIKKLETLKNQKIIIIRYQSDVIVDDRNVLEKFRILITIGILSM